jgi:2-methylfumaryl-CoA hydratase
MTASGATGPGGKTQPGNFFEDFTVGQALVHATPRTVTEGDVSLYTALFGPRFAVNAASPFARAAGYPRAPVDPVLVFHVAFGKTVPDISLNAIANLGYADGRFGVPVYPGDTIATTSRVLGVKANRDGATGVVYVRSTARNQRGEMVMDYARWVMVRKRDPASPAPEPVVPTLPEAVEAASLHVAEAVPARIPDGAWDARLAGSPHAWEDYAVGERIDHVDGMTVEEAEHMLAARLYQNTARVHFNLHVEREGRFGRRIVYGGHLISLARALSFNGLANAFAVVGINGGRHVNPTFAGDTIYAWSEVLDASPVEGRDDVGLLRLRTVATKDRAAADFPYRDAAGAYDGCVVLDFDYWVVVPRRRALRVG